MKSFGEAAKLFGELAAGAHKEKLGPVLDVIGSAVKEEVEKEIGTYQSPISPFPATAPLADATLERKERYGLGKYGDPDTPLWATGDYHDSIKTAKNISALSVEIGTNVGYVKYLELGTSHMPPRPVFGPATLRALPPLLPEIAEAAAMGIAGGAWAGLDAAGTTHAGKRARATVIPGS